MPVTGEVIRLMNYVDDIAASLRRIHSHISTMTLEEKKMLADHMRKSKPAFSEVMDTLEKVSN